MDEIKGIRIVSLTGEKEYGIEDSEVREELANVVDGAPEELDSFKEAFEKFKEGGEALAGIAAEVAAVGKAVTDETTRAQAAEEDLDRKITDEVGRAKEVENELANAITEESKATDEKIATEIDKIKDGDTIVAQAREIHSRNGKTVPDSFLVRTTAGSGTIGDGVASLKSVGGNIVKNLVDGTFESGWSNQNSVTHSIKNGVCTITSNTAYNGIIHNCQTISNHLYYLSTDIYTPNSNCLFEIGGGVSFNINKSNAWQNISIIWKKTTQWWDFIKLATRTNSTSFSVSHFIFIDLTEMSGAGNEPGQATCDKLFGTMYAMPQGLTIANPTTFTSTGFNQFNPESVLEGKAIVDNAIVPGDKKIAVIPCLPCKVGTGENNGYCIHGDFCDDIKVYLTPLNPMEVEGELYMHELTKDATTDTYVPLIKGYMLVEVPTTANLCAHFLWSEDKCERDSYEPYFESKIELPDIPQMSEWGLAGIQSSGTIVCDEIDFERGVYRKKIIKYVFNGGASEVWYKTGVGTFYNPRLEKINQRDSLANRCILISYSGLTKKAYGDNVYSLGNETNGVFYISPTFTNITEVEAWKDYLAQNPLELYYELATPEEYPLPKVDNNYISSDYGVEQFDSVVPCNANNLYYMRSLAGETRNFLDRMYDNTAKSDAKEVADYITNGIEGNKELATNAPNLTLRALFVAAGAEYNDTDNHIVKNTPWEKLVDSVDYKALWNLDVVTGSVQTLTYDGKSYEYVDDKGTWKIIARVGDKLIWDDTKVVHRKGYYYLTGLGDITEEQMLEIYDAGRIRNINAETAYVRRTKLITTLKSYISGNEATGMSFYYGCTGDTNLKVFMLRSGGYVWFNKLTTAFHNCFNLRYIYPILDMSFTSSNNNVVDPFVRCDSLVCCHFLTLKVNMNMKYSPLLSKKSILYTIKNAKPTSVITITLHADAYNRLANDADIVAALAAQPLVTLVSA